MRCVDRLALESGVRVLFIKGPTAVAQGLRAPRESLDVDALVDPARRDHLAERLAELGWVDEHPYTSPTVLPMHSTTHRHHGWPNELDLHDRFPGFFADAARRLRAAVGTAQDRQRRRATTSPAPTRPGRRSCWPCTRFVTRTTGARPTSCPPSSNGSRPPRPPTRCATSRSWRATSALRTPAAPFLDRVGAPAVGRGSTDPADLRAWELRTAARRHDQRLLGHELRQLPWRRRPRYLWYAAFLSDVELRLAEPNLPPGRGPLLHARIRRLRRGLRAVPSAVRSVHAVERAPRDKRP